MRLSSIRDNADRLCWRWQSRSSRNWPRQGGHIVYVKVAAAGAPSCAARIQGRLLAIPAIRPDHSVGGRRAQVERALVVVRKRPGIRSAGTLGARHYSRSGRQLYRRQRGVYPAFVAQTAGRCNTATLQATAGRGRCEVWVKSGHLAHAPYLPLQPHLSSATNKGRAGIDGAVTRSKISMAYSPYDRFRLQKIAAA